jgi:hypothetical protein
MTIVIQVSCNSSTVIVSYLYICSYNAKFLFYYCAPAWVKHSSYTYIFLTSLLSTTPPVLQLKCIFLLFVLYGLLFFPLAFLWHGFSFQFREIKFILFIAFSSDITITHQLINNWKYVFFFCMLKFLMKWYFMVDRKSRKSKRNIYQQNEQVEKAFCAD